MDVNFLLSAGLSLYRAENPPITVARGPVPRDCPICTENARCPEAAAVFCDARSLARDRPSPYVGRGIFLCPVARGPVPRDLPTCTKNARCPKGHGHFLSRSRHGEGQALALRLTRTVSYNGDGFLLPYQHLLRCREISRLQSIEIHPTCNRFSLCITAIPIRRSALALIDTGNLMSQC